MTFIEAPLEAQEFQSPPDYVADQCLAGGYKAEGNAAGRSGTNLKGLKQGPWLRQSTFSLGSTPDLTDRHAEYPTYGWTPKAIGALAGCIITALLGVLTVVWYSFGSVLYFTSNWLLSFC